MRTGYGHRAHAGKPPSNVPHGCAIFSSSFGGQVTKRAADRLAFSVTEEHCTGNASGSHPVSFEVGKNF